MSQAEHAPATEQETLRSGLLTTSRHARKTCFAVATLVFIATTTWALIQTPRANPYAPPQISQVAWWLSPVEFNAEQRLPVVTSDLHDVFVLTDPNTAAVHIWAVGDAGMIIHSADGGMTWGRQQLATTLSELPPRTEYAIAGPAKHPHEMDGVPVAYSGERRRPHPPSADAVQRKPSEDPRSIIDQRLAAVNKMLERSEGTEHADLYTVRGRVTRSDGQPLEGVVLLTSGLGSCTTDADGRYTTLRAPAGTSYWVIPDAFGYSFLPPLAAGTLPAADVTIDFTVERARATSTPLYAVYFLDAEHGWAGGADAVVYGTEDSGASWGTYSKPDADAIWAIHFDTLQHGLIHCDLAVLETVNGGRDWRATVDGRGLTEWAPQQRQDAAALNTRLTVAPSSGSTGPRRIGAHFKYNQQLQRTQVMWVPRIERDTNGHVRQRNFYTDSQADAWELRYDTGWLDFAVLPVHLSASQRGWQTPDDTPDARSPWTILRTPDSPPIKVDEIRIKPDAPAPLPPPNAVCFLDDKRAWAVGRAGLVLSTRDGGQSWFPQTRLLDPGVAQDTNAPLDAGTTTTPLARPPRYWRLPGPWYWFFACPLVGLLLVPVVRRPPRRKQRTRDSIADLFASDRPIDEGDPDPLNFHAVAAGLSRFLRNKATEPPLTIGITGQWGAGKSSLMNLLRADLRKNGLRTIWFNAWHHQKEEHLLAALLENIRAQAVPAWYELRCLPFRLRLAARRLARFRAFAWAALLVVTILAGYAVADPSGCIAVLAEGLDFINSVVSMAGQALAAVPTGTLNWAEGGSFVVVALALITSLATLWRGVRAFGVNPAALMASMSGKMRVRDLQAQVSLRFRFQREFQDVVAAMRPRVLVILIDDLDRCRPNNVLEVLEAVNFLVSCGGCHIILGMARDRVERCVGLGFKDVAEEFADDCDFRTQDAATSVDGRQRRAEFARHYLEKLINIEVPVPHPQTDQLRALLGAHDSSSPAASASLGFGTRLARFTYRRRPVICTCAVAALGFLFGYTALQHSSDLPAASNHRLPTTAPATQPVLARPPVASSAPATQPSPVAPATQPSTTATPPGTFTPQQSPRPLWTWAAWALAAVVGLSLWRLTIGAPPLLKDSPEFQDAMNIWYELVRMRLKTPRALKRFVNRVRFYAMFQHSPAAPSSRWGRFLAQLRGATAQTATAPQTASIPEQDLVALAALQHFDPPCLADDSAWGQIRFFSDSENPIGSEEPNSPALQVLSRCIHAHRERFGEWSPSEEHRQYVRTLSRDVRIL